MIVTPNVQYTPVQVYISGSGRCITPSLMLHRIDLKKLNYYMGANDVEFNTATESTQVA